MISKDVIARWDSMTPRERDAWVAETIFGHRVVWFDSCDSGPFYGRQPWISDKNREYPVTGRLDDGTKTTINGYVVPLYTLHTDSAFDVVAEVQRQHRGWRFCLLGGDFTKPSMYEGVVIDVGPLGKGWWLAEYFGEEDPKKDYGDRHGSIYAITKEPAMCLASLIAIEGAKP